MTHKIYRNRLANLFLFLLMAGWFCTSISAKSLASDFFTYEELTTLYEQEKLSQILGGKLNTLLTTPFVDNSYQSKPPFLQSARRGEFLRVAQWNIDHGLEYEAMAAAFDSEQKFAALLDEKEYPIGSDERREVLEQVAALRAADVIVLNEVDWGMKRTDYRHIAADLAARLKMNYAFGVQFVELSPVHLSQETAHANAAEKEFLNLVKVDSARYKGLQGIAILSRFPLENVRLVPFKTQPYNWYRSEKKGASLIEKGKRKLSKEIFLEKTLREVRRGGRTVLLADITDTRLPSGRVTIAATHLENRTKSDNRVKQLEELLGLIKEIRHPVIIAGDMNTSSSDLTPTSVRRELTKRYGSPQYWIRKGVSYALGFGLIENTVLDGAAFWRKQFDPTVRHIPFFAPNPERKFFSMLKDFRFADGGAFDFRGDPSRAFNNKSKTLANSNERGGKGFAITYRVNSPVKFVGKNKLDWIFVKPTSLTNPTGCNQSYHFAPHFGRTLVEINEILENRISDHHPIIVDLPLGEPSITEQKTNQK